MNKQAPLSMEQFREQVYQSFSRGADAIMELIDALCSQTAAQSVVELSMEGCFRRTYNSVYSAIDTFVKAAAPEKAEQERQAAMAAGAQATGAGAYNINAARQKALVDLGAMAGSLPATEANRGTGGTQQSSNIFALPSTTGLQFGGA